MTALTPGCRVWHLLDSSAIGGIETHVVALTAGLRAQGVDAHVVLVDDHGPHPMETLLADRSCPLHKLDGRSATLLRELRRTRPTVLHTHGYKAGIVGRLAGRLAGIPTVSTFHSGDNGQGRVRVYTALDRLTAKLGTCVAVNSAIASSLPGRVHVVGNGVPIPKNRPDTPGSQIAFVGRLSLEKGPDTFLELAAGLPHLAFDMFGDGGMRERIAGDAGPVRLHGAVPSMDPHWPSIGLLVMPSRAEGLPMAALEAMARGIPVAAFDVGALSALTAEGRGWCVASGDVSGLVAAIEAWSTETSDERRQRSAANARFVAEHYSIDRMVNDVIQIYSDLSA